MDRVLDMSSSSKHEKIDGLSSCAAENLPEDLWIRVLELLPWKSIVRASAVSRQWNNIIYSAHFQCRLAAQKPWFFVSNALNYLDALYAWDPTTKTWSFISLDFLQEKDTQNPVSSCAGLVYCMQEPYRDLVIEVFSPITRKVRVMAYSRYPRTREPSTPVVWSFTGDDTYHPDCHHLVVASSSEGWGTRLFCPSDADWEDVGEAHPKLRDSRDSKYTCNIGDEKFYVLVEDEVDAGVDTYGAEQVEYKIVLLSFDAREGIWEEHRVFPFERAEDAVVVEFHGALHLIAASCESDKLCIRIYKFLNRKHDAWSELAATTDICPFSFSNRLGFFQLASAASGDLIYVTGYAEDCALAAVCDFSTGYPQWQNLPNVPFSSVGFCFCCDKRISNSHF